MQFARLAEYLEQLEKTASRNEMTQILAQLYRELERRETKEVTHLLSGTLGPAYRAPSFGVADKMFLRVLGGEAGEAFKRLGDMGLVAEELHPRRTAGELSCEGVYRKMWEIATASGEGSQERKVELIRELMAHLDARSARYAARIVLGKLRTGFSEMTVLDALSWMVTGDKSLRGEIESMYSVRADLGEIAELIKAEAQGLRPGVSLRLKVEELARTIQPRINTPVLMAKAERAASVDEIWERNGSCAVEYKLDGLRIQAHIGDRVKLFSRGLEDVTAMYPDVVQGLGEQIAGRCIVEGEMIAVGDDGQVLEFKKTMNRKRKYEIERMSDEVPLNVFLFDILWLDGKSLLRVANSERWKILEGLVRKGKIVRMMPRIVARTPGEIEEFYKAALAEGMEGIIAKKLENPYTPGNRDFNWIKLKPVLDSIDVVVMGYSEGEGKRSELGIGEFLVGVYDSRKDRFLTITKVGSGATDEEWRRLAGGLAKHRVAVMPSRYVVSKQYEPDYWVEPKMVLEIVGNELSESPAHSSGYGLRFPRLVSFRDKKAEDATTVEEIKSMYQLQRVKRG